MLIHLLRPACRMSPVKGQVHCAGRGSSGLAAGPGGRTGAPAASGAVASQGSFASVERDGEDRAEVAATRGPKLDVALRSQPRPWGGKVLSVRTSWGTSGGASVLSGEVAQALAEWVSQRTLLSPEVQACVSLGDGQALPTATGQTRRPPATQEQPRRCGRTGPRPPGPPSGWLAGGSAGQLTCPLPFRSRVCLPSVL